MTSLMRNKLLFFIFSILVSNFTFSQNLSQYAEISILTCGVGNESYSLYGHTAIRVNDPVKGLDLVYNYGTFDFNTKNFILKFIKGDLEYFISVCKYQDFEMSYRYENRSIEEQILNISQIKKQQIFESLNQSLNSEDRFYRYKFIDKNCTNMVIDKINLVLKDSVIKYDHKITDTYRKILLPYSNNHYYQQLGINIMFGTKVDQKAQKLFLPFELQKVLQETKYSNSLFIKENRTLFKAKDVPFKTSVLNSPIILIVILLLLAITRNKYIYSSYFLLIGTVGTFLCWVGMYSFHKEVLWNYNALLFNPLFILLTISILKKKHVSTILYLKIIFLCLIVYLVYIFNKAHFLLMLPFIISHFLFLYFNFKKTKKFIQANN